MTCKGAGGGDPGTPQDKRISGSGRPCRETQALPRERPVFDRQDGQGKAKSKSPGSGFSRNPCQLGANQWDPNISGEAVCGFSR